MLKPKNALAGTMRRWFLTLGTAVLLTATGLGSTALAQKAAAPAAQPDKPLTATEIAKLLKDIDERQRNSGDWKGLALVKRSEPDKPDVVYKMVYYRRDADDRLMLLFLQPKAEAGKGYLRKDKNLWSYDPNVGKWQRTTERERIAGTDSRRADFDESRLAEEYDATFEGYGKLGKYKTTKLKLKSKKGKDVAWPMIRLEVDRATGNVLRRKEYALSGKLMRSSLYPKWKQVYSKSKKMKIWYPSEMRFFDKVQKGNKSIVVIDKVDLSPLPRNIFTKAWLESQSR